MAVSFNNNNNSELQMLFGKINNGSPFGVIRGFYDYLYMKTSQARHSI
ncbi:hypothetical protein HpCK101_24980 [Helicobacter pylori]